MCDFKPGDEVVCVNAGPLHKGNPFNSSLAVLTKGAHYTIVGVFRWGHVGVALAEVQSEHPTGGFDARRFRKVERRNDSLSIETFLTIKPGFEEPRRTKTPARKGVDA